MLAHDLVERVIQRLQEIGIGMQDFAIQGEFDHRLGFVDGVELGPQIAGRRRTRKLEHVTFSISVVPRWWITEL
jgi:hypothetical protein